VKLPQISATRCNRCELAEFVNVKVNEGVFSATQKKVTDAMVKVEDENMRPVTWVVVQEVASGDWGISGNPMHTADVKALAAGQPVN
jgi:4-oxalocrotonate tautomerase